MLLLGSLPVIFSNDSRDAEHSREDEQVSAANRPVEKGNNGCHNQENSEKPLVTATQFYHFLWLGI